MDGIPKVSAARCTCLLTKAYGTKRAVVVCSMNNGNMKMLDLPTPHGPMYNISSRCRDAATDVDCKFVRNVAFGFNFACRNRSSAMIWNASYLSDVTRVLMSETDALGAVTVTAIEAGDEPGHAADLTNSGKHSVPIFGRSTLSSHIKDTELTKKLSISSIG